MQDTDGTRSQFPMDQNEAPCDSALCVYACMCVHVCIHASKFACCVYMCACVYACKHVPVYVCVCIILIITSPQLIEDKGCVLLIVRSLYPPDLATEVIF